MAAHTAVVAGVLLLAALIASAHAARPADEITALPGWNAPLPSRMWSGHIDAGSDVQDGVNYQFHYWYMFVEAQVADPKAAPLVLWSNGGPGAASSYGLFAEFGPLILSDQSLLTADYNATGVPSLFYNPHAWTNVANILILNGGGPVGYTYCDPIGPAGNGTRCGSWDDERTATHNAAFVQNWLLAFPEYASLPLFLIGESYAGVYMPMLFERLLDSPTPPRNLQGLSLGDACMGLDVLCGPQTGPWFDLLFLGGHGCISVLTFTNVLEQCPLARLKDGQLDGVSQQCKDALAAANTECNWDMFYAYNYYDKCGGSGIHASAKRSPARAHSSFFSSSSSSSSSSSPFRVNDAPPSLPSGQPNGYPCGGDAVLAIWVQTPAVKKALNVAPDSVYFSGDNGVGFNYTSTYKSALPLVRRLQADGRHRVLAYNGDSDPGVSSMRSQNWTTSLGFPLVEAWRPFTLDGAQAVAGHVATYEGNFQFAQIKGAGHMVPMYAPREALVMLTAWLQNAPFPKFVPPPPAETEAEAKK